ACLAAPRARTRTSPPGTSVPAPISPRCSRPPAWPNRTSGCGALLRESHLTACSSKRLSRIRMCGTGTCRRLSR
ncbi:unnamed protein product, partial [Amoebophrya sp. A120]